MIIWIIGKPATGKSSLAQKVYTLAKQKVNNIVLMDGDVLRAIFDNDLGYTLEDRKKAARRCGILCRYLGTQGIHVIAAAVSGLEEMREWNRVNIPEYFEVYIDTPREELIRRDPKGLYKKALQEEIELPGINQPYDEPQASNLVIRNNGSLDALLAHAGVIAEKIVGAESGGCPLNC